MNKSIALAKSKEWGSNRALKPSDSSLDYHKVNDLHKIIGKSDFDEFARNAYDSADGYSIRRNPVTGKKEMFIAGTRNAQQWGLNALDGITYTYDKYFGHKVKKMVDASVFEGFPVYQAIMPDARYLDPWRVDKEDYLAKVAKNNDVDVIYGHSRGGALLADMDVADDVDKIGLDAAMIIARNKEMINLNEGGQWGNPSSYFDLTLGLTGQKNETFDLGGKFHHAWN